jgi:formamidopyrimidine-DNA glycosylase
LDGFQLDVPFMPELPDITVYREAIEKRILGQKLEKIRLNHPFLLKTVDPQVSAFEGQEVCAVRRVAKRIAIGFADDLWIVFHLMLAGRFQWKPPGFNLPAKYYLAAFDFPNGSLLLTEAGSKRKATLHLVRGEAELKSLDPGGLEVLSATLSEFAQVLRARNTTVKKILTDPKIFSGIGNAFSDEILHRAKLSPFAKTKTIDDEKLQRLYDATRSILQDWTERLRRELGDEFPSKVTAFRPDMAVHGKFGKPCPVCGAPIQRIRYAEEKECNYCPRCQTEDRLLADRSMSRLLKAERPKKLGDLPLFGENLPN